MRRSPLTHPVSGRLINTDRESAHRASTNSLCGTIWKPWIGTRPRPPRELPAEIINKTAEKYREAERQLTGN